MGGTFRAGAVARESLGFLATGGGGGEDGVRGVSMRRCDGGAWTG